MDSLFPFIQPQIFDPSDFIEQPLPMYTDVRWDFAQDKPVFLRGKPQFIAGRDAVLSWAWRALHQRRFINEIYTWNYGNELMTLVGQQWQQETKLAEAVRYVRECLLVLPYITEVANVIVSFDNGTIFISCSVHTVYGAQSLEVNI